MTRQNPWLAHVRRYRAQHGGTYHDALQGARASYRATMTATNVFYKGEEFEYLLSHGKEILYMRYETKAPFNYVTVGIKIPSDIGLNQAVSYVPVLKSIMKIGWFGTLNNNPKIQVGSISNIIKDYQVQLNEHNTTWDRYSSANLFDAEPGTMARVWLFME